MATDSSGGARFGKGGADQAHSDLHRDLHDNRLFRQQCFIGGGWVDAGSGATMAVDDPASGRLIGRVPRLARSEVESTIEAAHRAWPDWRDQLASQRGAILYRWHEQLMAHQEDLARIMTVEQGKPLAESMGEIAYAASFLKWFAEEAVRAYGDTIPGASPGQRIMVIRQPIGVAAAITPWNFPAAMLTRKAGAALAAGCSMVAKPASATPFSALALAELGQRAGLPDGVFNIVTGPAADIADTLTDSSLVRKLSFTGSTQVGRELMARCSRHLQKISLELGGNAPFIVFDDADLDRAVEGAIASKFRNTGQTCVCANRILVQDGVHDRFVEKLAGAIDRLRVGNGLEPGVTLGPLIDAAAVDKVQSHIRDALQRGATRIRGEGPREPTDNPRPTGNYVQPTLLIDIDPDMKLCQEETFGPVAGVMRFAAEQDAIRIANDTPYGLAGYFYSRDVHRCWRVAEALEVGMVGINTGLISNAMAPFGGVKESGIGREGSRYGLDEYMELKYLCMGAE